MCVSLGLHLVVLRLPDRLNITDVGISHLQGRLPRVFCICQKNCEHHKITSEYGHLHAL